MYKVIGDSSTEVDSAFLEKYPTEIVPFHLYIDGQEYIDNASMDVDAFVETMKASPALPKSSCPSPNDFLVHFESESEEVYVVTISSKLSGTYNSAMMAKELYETENPGKKRIHIFDSMGAAAGQTLAVRKIHELKKLQLSADEVIQEVTEYIQRMRVFFISESLDNLIKNGRISKWKGLIATTLKIHPIMGSDGNGEIKLFEKVRHATKAYQRLIEMMSEEINRHGQKVVAITHVGNYERANEIEAAMKLLPSIEVVYNLKCAGLSSLYADKKGIIVAF